MENGKSIGTERTILDEFVERRRELWAERDEVEARIQDVEAEIAKLMGDPLGAEWHRLNAIALRSGTTEDREAAHRAWLVTIATSHIKRGTRPAMGSHCQAEVDAEIDRLLGEGALQ